MTTFLNSPSRSSSLDLAATEPKYADQKQVFEDLGRDVLANAWEGTWATQEDSTC
jgi:hypothetical protein